MRVAVLVSGEGFSLPTRAALSKSVCCFEQGTPLEAIRAGGERYGAFGCSPNPDLRKKDKMEGR